MSLAACADLVARADPDRFRAAMAAPPPVREFLLPLYAFNVEVSRAPWVTREPMIAQMRLQWWADALDEIARQGGASGGGAASGGGQPAVRSHEVVTPLAAAFLRSGAPVAPLSRLVEARRRDIDPAPFRDAAALWSYLEATYGELMWAGASMLGAPEAARAPVLSFGRAAGLAAFFLAIPELEARGRVPLHDGRPATVRALAQEGLAALHDARRQRHLIPRAAAPALWPGWRAAALLRRARRQPGLVASGALEVSEFRRRAALVGRVLTGRW